jgi:hypothetical protein
MERIKHEFQKTVSMVRSNSYGLVNTQDDVTLEITVGIKDQFDGWFELYDIETGGEAWYAEGSIQFHGKYVVGYDGCFSLPGVVGDKLEELGYSLEEL